MPTRSDADVLLDTVIALDPLADLPRTGWLLRGVTPPESIAEHTFGVALVAMLLVDALRAAGHQVDGERVLRMAIVHDAAEARTGDVPMPQKTPAMREALEALEAAIAADILPPALRACWQEAETGATLEARVVKAADKLQMMIKAWCYERKRGARLDEFWNNPANFRDMGLDCAQAAYELLRRRAGRA